MNGQERDNEREPLLSDRHNDDYQSVQEESRTVTPSDDITAQIETIKENLSSRLVAVSLASTSTCLFIYALDGTLFITLLNDVSTTFSASDLSFWIGTSYMLSSCISAPIYSRLSDVFGRKNALICAVILFLIGNALCAIAPSMLALIAARSLAGLGGGGIPACYAIILGDLIPLRKRPMYQSAAQFIFSLGNVAGGPIGGLLGDRLGWRKTIASQIPILCLALFLQVFFLRLPDFPKTKEQKEQLVKESEMSIMQILRKRLDFIGCLLLASTSILLMVALSFLSAADLPFSNAKVWANFTLSAVLLGILVWYEAYIAKEPIIPLRLLKTRMVGSVTLYYLISSLAMALYYWFPIYFRSVLLQNAAQTGVHFISMTVATTVGTFFSGALITKTGRYRFFMLFCSLIAFITPIELSRWSTTYIPSTLDQNLILIPFGFGGAAMSTIMVLCVLASCPRESQATAIGLVYLSRSLGAIIGVSVFGTQTQYVLTAQLKKHITGPGASQIIDRIRRNANANASLPDDIKSIALRAYASAYRIMNVSIAILFFVCFLIVLNIKENPLKDDKKSKPASSCPEDESETRNPSTEERVTS